MRLKHGRNASNLIERGLVSREGHINWDFLNELN